MPRPPKAVPSVKVTTSLTADTKRRLDEYVQNGISYVAAIENAVATFLDDEMGTARTIRVPISDDMDARLDAYARNEQRHDPRRANIARDALNILLRTRDESQSEEFVVKLSTPSLIERFDVYRRAREFDRSRVAEKALDWYLREQARRDSQYGAMLRPVKKQRGRG